MSTSQTPVQRALSMEPLRAGDRAFFAAQYQNDLHQMMLRTFLSWEQERTAKRADLARLSGFSPAVITRILSDPSNYESSTCGILMGSMGRRIVSREEKFTDAPYRPNDLPPIQRRIAQMRGVTPQLPKSDVPVFKVEKPVIAALAATAIRPEPAVRVGTAGEIDRVP